MKNTPNKPVTLRTIAKALGVSHATVSLALRDSPQISATRRAEIKQAAKEMGYKPDPILRQLASYRKGSTDVSIKSTIAWINDWAKPEGFFKQSEFQKYYGGAKEMANKLGYNLEPFNTREQNITKRRLTSILSSRGIRGIIVPPHPDLYDIPDSLWNDFAILRIGFNNPNSKRHIVCPDQYEGGRIAAQNMLAAGYKRIGYIGYLGKEERIRHHFVAAFQTTRDLAIAEENRVPPLFLDSPNPVDGKEIYRKWLTKYKIDAVFVSAPKVEQWTRELGLRFGRDLGLAGSSIFDSGFDSGVDQRPFEIGSVAVQFLTRLIEHNEFGIPDIPQHVLVSPKWVSGTSLRDS
ncbi:LacI family transcriptional regulator [Puniceicoccaceae bacterium K14]|nr:LacI family transcriptional regulator [Puniceicoccaceae bacterium K14]